MLPPDMLRIGRSMVVGGHLHQHQHWDLPHHKHNLQTQLQYMSQGFPFQMISLSRPCFLFPNQHLYSKRHLQAQMNWMNQTSGDGKMGHHMLLNLDQAQQIQMGLVHQQQR